MGYADTEVRPAQAHQQPEWADIAEAMRIRRFLAGRPALVGAEDVLALRDLLAGVATGEALVLQAGDCAEDPADCAADQVLRKVAVLDRCAGALGAAGGLPVLRIGRIAGQFAKPRSR